jgi:hypothetical protein
MPTVVFYGGIRKIATAKQVRAGFRKASMGELAPLNRRLLLDARDHCVRGDLRRAVIDVATAVEVTLAGAIAEKLRHGKTPTEFVERVLNTNGLAEQVSLFQSLGTSSASISKKKLVDQLANPRNRAAHAGIPPTAEEMNRAFEVGQTTIDAIAPVPDAK